MNAREKWLTTGLVALALAFGWLALWQQARHHDAREAVRRYVELNEREEKEDAEHLALIRQARPEIRRSLTRGEFETALKRLKALEAEDEEAGDAPKNGKGLSIDTLWPPKSEERKRVEAVLQELVKKQREGYDVVPAQQQLAAVAEAARSGKRQEALDAFGRAAEMVKNAPLRPGFKAPVVQASATGGGVTPAELRKIEQQIRGIQAFRRQLPQLMAQVQGEQRVALEKAETLFDEMVAAHRQKRDVRPVMALLAPIQKEFAEARESNDWTQVEKRLEAARAMVKTASPLPAINPSAPVAPEGPGSLPPVAGGPGQGGGVGGTPAGPGKNARTSDQPPGAERLLQALDAIRSMPDADYQARKPMIAAMLAQAARQGGMGRAIGRPSGRRELAVLGGAAVRLELAGNGEFRGIQVFGDSLVSPVRAAGISLQVEGSPEIPLRGEWQMENGARRFRVEGGEGSVEAVVAASPEGVRLKVRTERTKAGAPGHLQVALPVGFGGWYWVGTGGPEVIAVDREYQVQLKGDKLPKMVLRNAVGEVFVEAPSASTAGYNGKQSLLWVRLPLGPNPGVIEHTVHLAGTPRTTP